MKAQLQCQWKSRSVRVQEKLLVDFLLCSHVKQAFWSMQYHAHTIKRAYISSVRDIAQALSIIKQQEARTGTLQPIHQDNHCNTTAFQTVLLV